MQGKGDAALSGLDYILIKKVLKALNLPDDLNPGIGVFDVYKSVIGSDVAYLKESAVAGRLPFIEEVTAALELCLAENLITGILEKGHAIYRINSQGHLIIADDAEILAIKEKPADNYLHENLPVKIPVEAGPMFIEQGAQNISPMQKAGFFGGFFPDNVCYGVCR